MRNSNKLERVEYDEENDIPPHYKAPQEKVAALKAAIDDIAPYLREVDARYMIDPSVKSALHVLMEAGGWETSGLYC
jgi:hypothetical protein